MLKSVEKDLPALLIVSQAELHEGVGEAGEATTREDLKVAVKAAEAINANAAGFTATPLARTQNTQPVRTLRRSS